MDLQIDSLTEEEEIHSFGPMVIPLAMVSMAISSTVGILVSNII